MKQRTKLFSGTIIMLILCIIFSGISPATVSAEKTDNKPSIMVEVYNGNTAKSINTLFPWFKITNTGNAPIPLSDIIARYYYTVDGNRKQTFWCDWCSKGNTGIVTGKFSTVKSNANNIDTCFEVGFKNEKIMLQPGESVEVHIRIAKEDWSNFNQENDYSFNSSAKTYVPQVKVPGFIKGKLVWGNDPAVAIVDDASIQLDRNELTLKVSETARLKATIVPSDISDKDIIWYSSDIHVAAVDKSGLVIGINEGTAIITASTADGSIKDTCKVRVIKADARGVLEGRIRDAVTHAEISGADISFYRETGKDYQITGNATSDSQGLFRISLPVGNYKAVVSKGKYISAVYYLTIQEGITTYSPDLYMVGDKYAGTGTVSGTVKNAADGSAVKGLSIKIRQGIHSTKGKIIAETVTTKDGRYSVNLPGGNYTAEVSGKNFITSYFDVLSIGDRVTDNQNGVVTSSIKKEQTRIVLTWGDTPKDLDAHLTGTLPNSTSFHVYHGKKEVNFEGKKYALLELEDSDGYGPETITIHKETKGTYTFYVHNFSARSKTSDKSLSNSGAQVMVYRKDSLIAVFNVPANQEGNLWTVFSMQDGIIKPINRMSYESDETKIGSQKEKDVWLEGAAGIAVKSGESIQLPGRVETTSVIEKIALTVEGTRGFYTETSVAKPSCSLSIFTIDTNSDMNPLHTNKNPFKRPGNYTIQVWAKAAGMEAKMIGKIPVTVLPPDEICITGVLAPMLKTNNFKSGKPVETPLEGFTVKIMDRSGPQEKLLATAVTRSDGSFSATIKNRLDPGADGYDIFLRFEMNDENAKIIREIKDKPGKTIREQIYKWDSDVLENVNYYKVDFGRLHPSSSEEIQKAFFLWNAVKDARNFYSENTKDHYSLPQVTVVWNPGEKNGYNLRYSRIYVDDSLIYDYSSVLHEYGHYIMDRHGAFPDGYKGAHTGPDPINPSAAYCEAWAEFFAAVVYGQPYVITYSFDDGSFCAINHETPEFFEQGKVKKLPRYYGKEENKKNSRAILGICGALWDLYDDHNDTGNDTVSLPFSALDSVMRTKCKTFTEFYDRLISMGYARGKEETVRRVIKDIDKAYDLALPAKKRADD